MRAQGTARADILAGRTSLGIELGSTRIKACLVGADLADVLATGGFSWESRLVDGVWSYDIDDVWEGLRAVYTELVADVHDRYGIRPTTFGAIGISAMMHGYLAFDTDGALLTPFRTWRNTGTAAAAAELSALFGVHVPQRWSVAHLHHAVRAGEAHTERIAALNTLAGYVHESLTGHRVLGIGDASGMFPIDPATGAYDERMLAAYDDLVRDQLPRPLRDLLPEVQRAGTPAGQLTVEGALLLDPSGLLQSGIPLCPPEGDAGTGMVATNAVSPRTGNVSAGTSIFAMVVLERPLSKAHRELDVVMTPAGDEVAMVHCNNGASDIAAWARLFVRFAAAADRPVDDDVAFDVLFREALDGEADAGGLLSYHYLAGEPIAGLSAGHPLLVRSPADSFTLANLMRSHLYGVFGALALGMRVLSEEGVRLDRLFAHGGLFRTRGVAQRLLAGALNVPVAVGSLAGEGGAWGIAVLASYLAHAERTGLGRYLDECVFPENDAVVIAPDERDAAGFASYLERYQAGLAIEAAAVDAMTPRT
ncbi:FGGY-family carbohydrate kinase [Microbacterium sp. NPDC028030]|uniref:xylulokinase n=1 Tax=Microbacterium sp. NPDC028030 TaxID=3155124 RepID=UPI0033D60231